MQKIFDIGDVPKREELAERFIFPFSQINYLLNGGEFDRVTLITSSSNNGKTTFASQIISEVIRQGYNACCFLGEDTAYESQERIFKQSVYGKSDQLEYKAYYANGEKTNCGEWVLKDEAWKEAREKFAGKLYLYNTNASAKVDEILDGFEEARTKYGCRVFLLDNCDQFEFSSDNENKAYREIVIKIRDFAIAKKVHIFLISHLRKIERDVLLPEMSDVKGTSSLVNIAKNVLIILRMDIVDHSTRQYKALKALLEQNNYNLDEADSLVYIPKTKGRKNGFSCLKYNKCTNTYYECRKIDESKEDDEKAKVVMPKYVETLEVDEIF